MIWANNLNRKLVVIVEGNKFRLYQMANGMWFEFFRFWFGKVSPLFIILYSYLRIYKKKEQTNKLYFQIKSKFRRRQLVGMGAFVGKLCKSVFQAIKDLAICGAKTYANTDWLTDILTQACCWLDDWMTGRPTDGGFQPTKMKVKNCVHVNTSHISVMPRNQPTQTKPNRTVPNQAVSTSVTQCLVSFLFPTPVRILILIQNPILVCSVCAMHFWHFIDWRGNIEANIQTTHTHSECPVRGENANI